MQIINTETKRWPMSLQDVVSEEQAAGVIAVIGDGYRGHGPYRIVARREVPSHDPLVEYVVPLAPEVDAEGNWSHGYEVRAMPAEEIMQALQDDKARLIAAATARRWAIETGGMTLADGTRLGTAISDQNRLTAVIANAEIAGMASVDFKAASGWLQLTLDDLREIASAMAMHVQACFSAERRHHEAIAALQARSAAATYDVETGWPL